MNFENFAICHKCSYAGGPVYWQRHTFQPNVPLQEVARVLAFPPPDHSLSLMGGA